jgi:hypothetical protein
MSQTGLPVLVSKAMCRPSSAPRNTFFWYRAPPRFTTLQQIARAWARDTLGSNRAQDIVGFSVDCGDARLGGGVDHAIRNERRCFQADILLIDLAQRAKASFVICPAAGDPIGGVYASSAAE